MLNRPVTAEPEIEFWAGRVVPVSLTTRWGLETKRVYGLASEALPEQMGATRRPDLPDPALVLDPIRRAGRGNGVRSGQ